LTGGYEICIDNEIHGDTEHLYIVNVKNKIIEHYTPTDSSWFDSESLEEIVSRDPNAVYSLDNDRIENLSPRMVEREVVLKQGRTGEDRDVIQNTLTKAAPICQADDCTNVAVHVRSSLEGHPNGEWKLCREHFNEVDGKDPWYNEERDWTLKKLYYRCPNGGKISHNSILKYEDEGGYPCSCGERHLPEKPDDKDLDGVPQ